MNRLSIFTTTSVSWDDYVAKVNSIIGLCGMNESDDLGNRCKWSVLEIEFIGIDKPNLDDDVGIAFSTFNRQLCLTSQNMVDIEETVKFYDCVANFVARRIAKEVDNRTYLVSDLQFVVPIFGGNICQS